MPDLLTVIVIAWGALSGVWTVLLVMQRRAARDGLLLQPVGQADGSGGWPSVAAIIPARNESPTIESCVKHVLTQDYPHLAVTVVDDRSEDDTADVLAPLAERDPRLRLLHIRSLPAGWLAKSHALWRGTRGVDADWLLFVDADASLDPTAVRTAVAEAQRRDADVLSLFPRNAAVGFWEHLIIPLCGGIIALWFGGRRRPFANGQFLLVRRDVYERVGGHAAVKDALIEDVPLAEACAAAGATVVAAGGAEILGVRMYDSFRSVCDGWTRIFAGAIRSPLKLIVSVLWLVFGSLLPHAALPVLAWNVVHNPTTFSLLLLAVCAQHLVLIYVVSFRFWGMGRCDRRYLWLYPLSVVIVTAVLLRATWLLAIARTVTWRGVHYTVDGRARLRVAERARPKVAWAAWVVWFALAAVSAGGLRHYRVDNSLDAWLPKLRAVGPQGSYAVLGWETIRVSRDEVAARIAGVRGITMVIDRLAVERLGPMSAVTPDDFVVSADGSYEGMFVFRDADVADADFVAALRTALSPFADNVAVGGPAVYAVTLDEVSQQRMPVVMAAVTATGLLSLWLLIGSLRAAAAGIAAITLSQAVLLGGLSWFDRALDMSLMMVPPLMMSLGVSYVAHRALGRRNSGVLALCAITSAMGIGSFVMTPLPPIRSFAVVGMVGLALTWLAVVTLVPRAAVRRGHLRVTGLRLAVRLYRANGAAIIAAALIVFAALPLLAPRLRFASNPLGYFPPTHRAVRDFAILDRRLTGMLPFQVISSDPAARDWLERTPGVRTVIEIPMLLADGTHAYWCLADNDSLPQLAAAETRWRSWAGLRQARFEWRGVAAQLRAAEQTLRRIAFGSLGGMAAVAAAVVILRTRHVLLGMLVAPLTLLPVAALVELGALLDIPVTLASLMIGSISIGMAVDDVLHITCATQARGSVIRGTAACWRGCVGSSLINILCLSCFVLSPFRPTQQFGLLLAAAAALAMFCNQLVLPALLALALGMPRPKRAYPCGVRNAALTTTKEPEVAKAFD